MKKVKGIRFSIDNDGFPEPKIEDIPLSQRVVLPLVSKFGKMLPLVSPGDSVQTGQIIAKGPEKWSPPLLATVTGRVSEITLWPTPSGEKSPAIVIESPERGIPPKKDELLHEDMGEVMRWIQAGGIREVDSSPVPLALRLRKPELAPSFTVPFASELEKPIQYLIINGMDRQPGVWLRNAMIRLQSNELLESIPVLKKATGASRVFFTVFKGQVVPAGFAQGLRKDGVELVSCPNTYPIALEAILVPFLTGKELPVDSGSTRAFGSVVVDVITALKVFSAAHGAPPSLDTVVQITAPSAGVDTLVRVREGTLLEDIMLHLGLPETGFAKVLCGGPLLGTALHRLDIPITQEIDSIILQGIEEITHYSNEPCVNCGYCVQHCPMKLLPNELSRNCEYEKFDVAERMDLFCCIECGICAYVCPVHRPVVQLLQFGKREIEAMRKQS